jgi:MFS family permease
MSAATRSTARPVLAAALGVLTVALDAAVNIAFPAISAALHVPATSIQWIVLTYMGTFAVVLIPAGRLADRIGHGRVFHGGLALTGLAHGLCGLAPTWTWLLSARVAQGVGAALVMASAPALVSLATSPGRRGRAFGWLGVAASLGAVLGPLGGGVLVGTLGWRVVYLGRLPLVALALGLGRALPVKGAPGTARAGPGMAPAGGAARGLADARGFVIANAAHLLAFVSLFAVWLLVPYYLIDRRGFSAGLGGLLFATGPLAQACAAALGGRLADRGAGRWLAPLGLAVEGSGLWLTGGLDDVATPARIALAVGLGGFGSGLFLVSNMHYVMAALSPSRQGTAGSLVALMRTVGVVVGASVTTAVYAARLSAHAGRAPGDAAALAFTDAFTVAAAIAAAAALLSLVPPRVPGGSRAPAPVARSAP